MTARHSTLLTLGTGHSGLSVFTTQRDAARRGSSWRQPLRMMRSPNKGMKEEKIQFDHPRLCYIDAHHGLASIGFTHSALVLEYKQMRPNR
jgi:hypothetical protein